VIQAAWKIARDHPAVASRAENKYESKIAAHCSHVTQNSVDPPEIADRQWHHG